jgi:hypothetical protein
MATGLELYDALKSATKELKQGERYSINLCDSLDLRKLTEPDLLSRGFSPEVAHEACVALRRGDVENLGRAMGLKLHVERKAPNLIPGESLRRMGEIMKDDVRPLEEDFAELDRIRHPERFAS